MLSEGVRIKEWKQRIDAVRLVDPAARRLINGSVSENTRRVYVSQLRKLNVWLKGRELTDASLAEYIGWLYDKGVAAAAVIALMSDAMLRVSEAAALGLGDVTQHPDGSGRVRVRKSKTDPTGEGRTLYIGPQALQRYQDWLAAAGIQRGRAFRQIRKGGHLQAEGLTAAAVRGIIKHRARTAGIENKSISGQSLRIGMAQTLAAAGASVVEMQLAGRWKSPQMPARYASGERAGRNAVARLVHGTECRSGNQASKSPGGIRRHAMRVAEQFQASGNREGRLLARALRGWAEDMSDKGRPSASGLLNRLSELAEIWQSETGGD